MAGIYPLAFCKWTHVFENKANVNVEMKQTVSALFERLVYQPHSDLFYLQVYNIWVQAKVMTKVVQPSELWFFKVIAPWDKKRH